MALGPKHHKNYSIWALNPTIWVLGPLGYESAAILAYGLGPTPERRLLKSTRDPKPKETNWVKARQLQGVLNLRHHLPEEARNLKYMGREGMYGAWPCALNALAPTMLLKNAVLTPELTLRVQGPK